MPDLSGQCGEHGVIALDDNGNEIPVEVGDLFSNEFGYYDEYPYNGPG